MIWEDDPIHDECPFCGEVKDLIDHDDDMFCEDCVEAMINAVADLRAERRAERSAMACDLGIGPSDPLDD